MNKLLRIAFMGTPDFSVGVLEALIQSQHEVVCVYSQPPRPKGRGKKVQSSPVHICAESAGIEVRTPLNFKNVSDLEAFKALDLDVAVVVAYGLILPVNILEAPQYGCINIHASILPRWRGAAPIHRAIWAGDAETGITLMQMDKGLDTGDMISVQTVPITPDTTLAMMHDELSALGASMIIPCLGTLADKGGINVTPQPDEGMTYAHMLKKNDGRVDWSQSAVEIDRQVRGLNPWPGTWTMDQNNKRIKVLKVSLSENNSTDKSGMLLESGKISCGNSSVLQLEIIQPENKKSMDVEVALNRGYLDQGKSFL